MKAPKHREYVHHVRTEKGTSTYQIRSGMGDDADVIAVVVCYANTSGENNGHSVHCMTCNTAGCSHAKRVLERATGGK